MTAILQKQGKEEGERQKAEEAQEVNIGSIAQIPPGSSTYHPSSSLEMICFGFLKMESQLSLTF